ncbi:hypothetical protein H312_03297, partial [Anncaliia algerae PRA339]
KIKYNFYFKGIISEELILELIDSGIFIDSLLSYTLSILYNKEPLRSNNNLRIFIKYIFRKDVLLEWSEIISLQKDKSKKCAINFESSEIITNKNSDIDIISDTFLDLDFLFLEKISLQEFFIKAIHFEKEKQRILINLKSHDILKHFINQIPDKSIINLTYNNNEKETYSLFHTLNDEFELKKFIIQNNAAYLCDLLLTQSNTFDNEYVQALIICEDYITKIGKQLINLVNSSYLQLFLKKTSTFTKFCDNIKNSSEISPIILLKNIDYDENYIEKYKIFQEYFKYEKTFLEEFIKFLNFYFNTKKFPIDNTKLLSEIFTVRRENSLKPFYVSLINHDPDLFVDFLFKEEVTYDTFFIDCVMLLCNICDFKILEKIKKLFKKIQFKNNYWSAILQKSLIPFYYKRNGTFKSEAIKNSPLINTKDLIYKEKQEYPNGLALNNSKIEILVKNDFTIYLYFTTFSAYVSDLISFQGINKNTFEIMNNRIVLKNDNGYFLFPQDKSGQKKIISFEKIGDKLKIYTGHTEKVFKINRITKITIGEDFRGIISKILITENKTFCYNIFSKFQLGRIDFYLEVIKNLEKKLNYNNQAGVYIDGLCPYFLTKNKLQIEFTNVLYNENFPQSE